MINEKKIAFMSFALYLLHLIFKKKKKRYNLQLKMYLQFI